MKRETLHAIFLKGGEKLPMTSAGRCRSVRRALYMERKRVMGIAKVARQQGMWDSPIVHLADAAEKLQFRIEATTLIIEPVPQQSPVDVELEKLKAGCK